MMMIMYAVEVTVASGDIVDNVSFVVDIVLVCC